MNKEENNILFKNLNLILQSFIFSLESCFGDHLYGIISFCYPIGGFVDLRECTSEEGKVGRGVEDEEG